MDAKVLEFERECIKFFAIRRHKHRLRMPADMRRKGNTGDWKRVGSGFYGEAWEHYAYDGLVLKISGPSGWGTDAIYLLEEGPRPDAWPIYAEHCMHNPDKHLPKVYALHRASPFMSWGILKRYREMDSAVFYPGLLQARDALNGYEDGPKWIWPLKQMAGGLNMTIDVHDGNIMVDADTGDWVITDPFSTDAYTPNF